MGVDYSKVNPQATMGSEIFNQSDIKLVDTTFSNLKAGNLVSTSDLEKSTIILESRREHPLHGKEYDDIISGLYALSPTPENQAHVIGNLIAPNDAELVESLFLIPNNPLAKALGPAGVAGIVEAATNSTEHARTAKLIMVVQESIGIVPTTYEDESDVEQQAREDATGWLSDNLAKAIKAGDAKALELALNGTPNKSLLELSNRVAQMGDSARPVLNMLINSSDSRTSQFAFSTLLQIGNTNLPPETNSTSLGYPGQGNGSEAVDMSSLESLLMAPENTPATLARQFAGVPGLHTHLIKLMIR